MPNPLIIIIVAVAVLAIGLVFSILLSKNARQRRAVIAAFVSLIVMGVVLYIVVITQRNEALFPLLAVLCLAIPTGIYLGLVLPAKKSSAAKNRARRVDASSKTSTPEKQGTDKDSRDKLLVSRTQRSVQKAESTGLTPAVSAEKPQPEVTPAPSVIRTERDVQPSRIRTERDVQPNLDLLREPVEKPEPEVQPAEEPAVQPEPQPAAEPEPQPVEQPAEEPAEQPAETPAEEPAEQPAETPAETPAEQPEAETPLAAETTEFDTYYAKAESFAQKGLHSVAGKLFEESATLTSEAQLEVKAILAAMNAYLRAGKKDDVRRLALTVKDSGALSSAQESKFAIIEKML